jgi:hypothetical protein
MKTLKYNPHTIKLIQIIILLFGLQINLVFAENPTKNNIDQHFSICVTCSYSVLEIQKEELFNELFLLSPTTPTEATFTEETIDMEVHLAPTIPEEVLFDNDSEFMSTSNPVQENLIPTTPAEADFDN